MSPQKIDVVTGVYPRVYGGTLQLKSALGYPSGQVYPRVYGGTHAHGLQPGPR